MKNGLKHKLIDLLIFGSLFGLVIFAVRDKSRKDPYWLRGLLLKYGFVKWSDSSKVIKTSDILKTPGAKGLTAGEAEFLIEKGMDKDEVLSRLLPGEQLMGYDS